MFRLLEFLRPNAHKVRWKFNLRIRDTAAAIEKRTCRGGNMEVLLSESSGGGMHYNIFFFQDFPRSIHDLVTHNTRVSKLLSRITYILCSRNSYRKYHRRLKSEFSSE